MEQSADHLLNVLDNLVTLAIRRHGTRTPEVMAAQKSLEWLKADLARLHTTLVEPPGEAEVQAAADADVKSSFPPPAEDDPFPSPTDNKLNRGPTAS